MGNTIAGVINTNKVDYSLNHSFLNFFLTLEERLEVNGKGVHCLAQRDNLQSFVFLGLKERAG